MVTIFKLAREQLSKQCHYDFGMRALQSIIRIIVYLKNSEPFMEDD